MTNRFETNPYWRTALTVFLLLAVGYVFYGQTLGFHSDPAIIALGVIVTLLFIGMIVMEWLRLCKKFGLEDQNIYLKYNHLIKAVASSACAICVTAWFITSGHGTASDGMLLTEGLFIYMAAAEWRRYSSLKSDE